MNSEINFITSPQDIQFKIVPYKTIRLLSLRTIKLIIALSVLYCLSMSAHAEGNCPSGYYPIGGPATAGCAPIPGGGYNQAPNIPEPIWEDRWGAIAFDGPKGILGASADFKTEQDAKSAAINHCKSKGGVNCLSELTYRNACASFTIGDKSYYRGARPILDQVVAEGLKLCKEKDTNCETYYSACTAPVRIR